MATNYIVDPTKFYAEERCGLDAHHAPVGHPCRRPRIRIPAVQLRWMLQRLGMPTEPRSGVGQGKSVQGIQEPLLYLHQDAGLPGGLYARDLVV